MQADVVLCDLDGTLSDPQEGMRKAYTYALGKMGVAVPPPEVLKSFIGPPLRQNLAGILGPDRAAEVPEAADHYYHYYNKMGGFTENVLYPGISGVVKALRGAGRTLILTTSKMQSVSAEILAFFGLASFFLDIVGSTADGGRTDKAEIIQYALSKNKLDASRAVMIGDRKFDMIGAEKNGVASIGACWGYGSVEELRAAGAQALAYRPGELLPLLGLRPAPPSPALKPAQTP